MSSGMRTGPWRLRIPPETAISVGISRGFTPQQNNCRRSPETAVFSLAKGPLVIIRAEGASGLRG